ncbi:hypothetical protein Taro_038941 [Colocasia esculenta]|uniref:RING-type E3 ubiquitin transferase n=1 Tax=Colocasia esculenta TaxID=4460 RepID=A0A843WU67_COLES|nr:hypothetical protein [Colocasia esculenta]
MAAVPVGDDNGAGGPATRLRRLLLRGQRGAAPPDHDRALLISTTTSPVARKGGLGSAAALFRGLGCASADAALAYAPPPPSSAAAAVVRASADWQTRRAKGRRRSGKGARRKDRDRQQHYAAPPPAPRPLPSRRNVSAADIWCATGIAFSAAGDDSIDCVVPSHQRRCPLAEDRGGGRISDGERIQRERPCVERREGGRHLEQLSSLLDFPSHSAIEVPPVESDLMLPGHRCHLRRFHAPGPEEFEEIVMLQSRLLLGGMGVYDRHRDWRLDVDNMTYEELLELGDKIGYVNTGLREDEIFQCLRKTKHSIFHGPPVEFSTEAERVCSICQEEYKLNDEVGKLECGHCYHMYCIKQWLLHKNICPVCKTAAARS